MLKNVLYVCALTSLVTLSTYADNAPNNTVNPAVEAVIIEKEEPTLANSQNSLLVTIEAEVPAVIEAPVVNEEKLLPETLAGCPCKDKDKGKGGGTLLACCGEDEEEKEEVSVVEEQISTLACGKCRGKHLILVIDEQAVEGETVILKTVEEEVKAA